MISAFFRVLPKRAGRSGVLPRKAEIALFAVLFPLLFPCAPSQARDVSASGITQPVRDVTINATNNFTGTIASIPVKEGSPVKKGQIILELEKKLETLEVERRKLIWEAKAELEAAVARASILKTMLDSTKELYKSTASVSREDVQKAEIEYELAEAEKRRLEAAEERERIEYEIAQEALQKEF